jgi:uncharacterized repeat protein (TIGR01451 family)
MIHRKIGLALMLWVVLTIPLFSAHFRVLHSFAGAPGDGSIPTASLVLDGSTLYGMTALGGANARGTVFRVNTDGTGFRVLHSFAGAFSDGDGPLGSLLLSGSTLYGMTCSGGGPDFGTVFKINTDGTGFAVLHFFSGAAGEGKYPFGSLVKSGATLYGLTSQGGIYAHGTIFKINMDGTGFSVLRSFAGAPSDGDSSYGSLVLSSLTFYGMTYFGGSADQGTIFKINADGTGFGLLHSFARVPLNGDTPEADLVLSGSTLYGMTSSGGASDNGTVFKINTDGTGFVLLHSFAGGEHGNLPRGSLIFCGSSMFGMTSSGGAYYSGTIFRINTDGSGFAYLHSFKPYSAGDGDTPQGSLVAGRGMLYGMTRYGGAQNCGTIFSFNAPAADIAVAKSSDNAAPQLGDTFNFTITAINKGPDTATGLKIKDLLPGRLSYVASSASQGTYKPAGGIWSIGTLAKGATATLTITVKTARVGKAINRARVAALNELDLIPSNNAASVTVNITSPVAADKEKRNLQEY